MSEMTQTTERPAADARDAHGGFVWYELISPDPNAAARFYGDVVGWQSRDAGVEGMDYRLLSIGGEDVAGFMAAPSPDMHPGWVGYIGVDDVDAAVARIVAAGGAVHMPAMDLEGVGRMAMVADPQGAPFYVMRGSSDAPSTSFAPDAHGHAAWNELVTSDQVGALAFYQNQFGWTKGDAMPMGEMGDYQFIEHGGEMIGAVMTRRHTTAPVVELLLPRTDICRRRSAASEMAARRSTSGRRSPGGDMVIQATDPQGAAFMVIATAKSGE
jgi:predicted enzyme related to lactoylglutathione lyase